jgi:hypothetical protein
MPEQFELDFGPPLPSLSQLWTPDDIFLSCTEETIERFREDNRVERKPGSIKQGALADYVSMWANTQPHGGITFLGVADNGRIIGCLLRKAAARTADAVCDAIADALDAFPPQECANYLKNSGYRT